MSGAVLGIGDTVCKFNDELKLERDESPEFYVLMTCHSRDLWCTCAHIYFRNDNWDSILEQVRLIEHVGYLLKIENYVSIRITCIYTPLHSLLYR